jgi:hypothetical protein
MRVWITSVFVAAAVSMCSSSAFPYQSVKASERVGFEIKELTAKSGAKFYGVKCRSETPNCNYDWTSFCAPGAARYATASGTESSSPNLIRAPDGLFMLLFLCTQGPLVLP